MRRLAAALALLLAACSSKPPREERPRAGNLVVQIHSILTKRDERLQGTVVDLYLSVWKAGSRESIREIKPENLALREDGRAADVESISTLERVVEIDVVLLLDFSYSMVQADALEAMKDAAAKFCEEATGNRARVCVVKFATSARVISGFESDAQAAIRREKSDATLDRFTSLYDAVGTAADQFGDDGRRKVVVIFSDGADNHSKATLDAAAAKLESRGIIAYAIGLGNAIERGALEKLTASGRVLSTADPSGLKALFEEIADRLGNLYHLQYISPRFDDASHRLQLEVRAGGLSGQVEFSYRVLDR